MGTKQKTAKVIVGMPCTDVVRARTAHAIGCVVIGSDGLVVDYLMRQSCDIVSSRTWLVNEAIRLGATHLFFTDADMAYPDDTIVRMLAHKKDIVGVRYHRRKFPPEWTHKALGEESETELFEAQYAGTGCMLIDLSIFKEEWTSDGKKTPWFSFGRDSQGALVLGEDAWFCNTARDMGFKTWVDPTILVGHVGEYTY